MLHPTSLLLPLLLSLSGCAPTGEGIDSSPTLRFDASCCGGDSPGEASDSGTGGPDSSTGDSGAGDSDTGDSDSGDSGTSDDTGDSSDTAAETVPRDPPSAPIVVYAIRHAEKDSEGDDPGLTEEGQARALALVDVMHDVPLSAIYATDLLRTQETVAPTAADHGLTVVTDIDPEEELADHIYATHPGETVLHCGHSYTLTDFMEALGIVDAPSASDYGDLWIITIGTDGSVTYETSHYGE